MQGIGSTLEQYTGKGPLGTWLQEHGKGSEPPNFVPSPLVDDSGVHPSNILRSLARSTPGAVAALGAASMAPEALGVGGAIAAGTGIGTLMSAGDAAKAAAVKRTGDVNATPNAADLTRGGLTSVASSAVQSLPINRFLAPGAGAVASNVIGNTGMRGVLDAGKKALTSTGEQAAASGASNVVSQVGQSVATPGGVSVDPTQAFNAAATGGVMGGAFAAKRALPEALDAAKFSDITPELKPAATQFANRMVTAADGRNLQGQLLGNGPQQRAGEDSFVKAKSAVQSELGDAVSKITTPLPTEAQNILSAARAGNQPTPGDYAKLKAALANDPQGANVINLVQQAHAGDIFGDTGGHHDGKFVGGGAGALGHALSSSNVSKTALAALVGGEAGHLISFSPEMLAVAGGASVAARMLNNMTGAQAPAGRIVRNFADGQTPVRLNVPPPQQPAPAPIVRPGPTGPGMAPLASPWDNPANPAPQAAPAPTPEATIPKVPKEFPEQWLQRMKAQSAASDAVNASPFIDQKVGGAENIPSPAGAKVIKQALGSASALAKLNSDPEAEAEAKAQAKADAADVKAKAKAATVAAKVKGMPAAAKEPAPQGAPAKGPIDLPDSFTASLKGTDNKPVSLNDLRAAVAPKVKGTPQAPQITGVKKSNGSVGTDTTDTNGAEYTVPRSPYAHLVPSAAAQQFLADAQKGGATIASKQGFLNGTQRNISDIRARAAAVAQAVPGVNPQEIAAQFEGVSTQKDAIRHREWLKTQLPQASAALDRIFSDEVIQGTKLKSGIWKRVGK